MIKENVCHGTTYSGFTAPAVKELQEYTVKIKHEASKKDHHLHWKIDCCYVAKNNAGHEVDVLKSQSSYLLTIEHGVTAKQLYEVVKDAVNKSKKCPSCNEEEKLQLNRVQYPSFEHGEEKVLTELAKLFE